MANAREIQSRMRSIKDTMKITNAMYMVSSSKLQKARKELNKTTPYFNMIQDSLAKLLEEAPEAAGEFFNKREHKKGSERMAGYLVITADKGLAGAYNHNIIHLAEKIALNDEADMLFVVGQLGRHYFETKDIPIDINFNYTAQNPTMNRARHIATRLIQLFLEEKIDDLYVLYTRPVNSMTVEAVSRIVLPLRAEKITPMENDLVDHYEGAAFIPDANTVFEKIVPDYIAGFIFGALVESYCSEHNSRMLAMQTATESAQKMLKELSIKYNRARQAAITQEITEVVSGSRQRSENNSCL